MKILCEYILYTLLSDVFVKNLIESLISEKVLAIIGKKSLHFVLMVKRVKEDKPNKITIFTCIVDFHHCPTRQVFRVCSQTQIQAYIYLFMK